MRHDVNERQFTHQAGDWVNVLNRLSNNFENSEMRLGIRSNGQIGQKFTINEFPQKSDTKWKNTFAVPEIN